MKSAGKGMLPGNPMPLKAKSCKPSRSIGVQFHPELRSRALHPHPLFHDFVAAARKFAGK
ncbi:MAG: hypothetical protein ONB48_08405 [candidate division KSB1 bacterium]|nr:hypothetical protein [candidate division KSB1 bacterium]MDZ7276050.1 hypothetical protein [candidate division KSB1 bacterium]MDZ7285668.1 hypothetical protein [candidate division KSB1 bacterium]MDZ7298700.1 hypothetical protein [candidate division KSB1 bacterium]MDZ7307551.1 hypothetical protein [candidate division KSB1 bacterium]